jgi:error-prone DNA polymerase
VLLYTEMVSIGALQRGDPARALTHDPAEHRLALQLGEASPKGSGAARAWPRSGVSMRSTSTSDARANASKNTGSVFPDPQGRDRPLNVIVWSSLFERERRIVLGARLMGVTGEVQREGEIVHLIARKLEDRTALLGGLRTVSRDFC